MPQLAECYWSAQCQCIEPALLFFATHTRRAVRIQVAGFGPSRHPIGAADSRNIALDVKCAPHFQRIFVDRTAILLFKE
jgi:hypothetical protein